MQKYIDNYPMGMVAQKAVAMVKKIIPYCDGKCGTIITNCEQLQLKTYDYNHITIMILPMIKLLAKEVQQICTSLQTGLPDIEETKQYFLSGQHDEVVELVGINYYIKCQEVAPNWVHKTIQHGLYYGFY